MMHKKETQVAEVDISSEEKSSSQVNKPKWGRSPAKKNHSLEPDDFSLDEEEEIERLIALKTELQKRVAQEADANAKLKAKLKKRKKALHKRRLALEKDVAKLQKQLQKERDVKASLEAEMSMTSLPSSKDKMKVDIERIGVAEEKFNNLKQRVDDLGVELNHQIQQNRTLVQNRGINMEKVTREASPRIERSSESERQSQSNDPLKDGSSKTGWLSADSSMEVTSAKNSFSPSNKSLKGEVAKLQEQLQKERDIKAALEAEMSMTSLPSSKDKMKVDIEGIGVAEEKFNNLKQRLDDLGVELNHQIHHFRTLMKNRSINMDKATREASPRIERSNESQHQNQSNDPLTDDSSKTGWLSPGSSMEVAGAKNFFSPSTKYVKGEGDNPTLAKLTTRLNLLKERRNQIAGELQNIYETQEPSGTVTQNPNATTHNVEKSRSPEGNSEHHTHHQPPNNQGNANWS